MIQLKNFVELPILMLLAGLLLTACEERFQPELTDEEPELVIEGHIEAGDTPLPPYIILTRTLPFYSNIHPEAIDELFVHNAVVRVSDGEQTVTLEEVCLSNIPPELQAIVAETLTNVDTGFIDYCLYTDPGFSMVGEVGKTYDLYVETDREIATATTTIPEHVPLDSVYFVAAPGGHGDSLLEMRVKLTDPVSEQYYRYFTSTNGGLLYPSFGSVFDDAFFNGQTFEFPLPKGEPPYREADDGVYGLHLPGDEVNLKWTNLDRDHHDFWDTVEYNKVNQGPFGSYTQIKTNIEGGLGIWGGYSVSNYLVVAVE